MAHVTLSDVVHQEGYTLRLASEPWREPDALGHPGADSGAAVCAGQVIACRADCWDYAYCCAHEIAEATYGFQHSADMFSYQANVLARWLKAVASAGEA